MWQAIVFFFGTAIGAWFLPQKYNLQIAATALTMGILIDLFSLFCYLEGIRTKRNISGVPIGIFCYFWFLIAAKFALIALKESQIEPFIQT
jgi:hypothetical protein